MMVRLFAAMAALGGLWLVGSFVYFRHEAATGIPVEQHVHLIIVLVLGISIVLRASTVRGSLEDRLKQVVISTCVMFGAYAFVILVGRYFFSRTILSTMVPITLLVSVLVVWWRSRGRDGVRTAVIAPLVQSIPPELGAVDILDNPLAEFRPYDLVLVDLHEPVSAEWASALSRAMLCGCRIRHIEHHLEDLSGAVSIEHFELEHLPAVEYASYIPVKRLMDIGGVLLLAPIVVPLILLGAVAVVLTSGFPAFFVQPRVGLGGALFPMWKLRTMRPAGGETGPAAVPGDSRVTPIGRLLRRTRIDELPQMWNVLKGDMSLIGPRPEAVEFHNAYVAVEPKFAYRCLVRPGISGWAQVNAPPSANPEEAVFKARYDLYYIKRQSLALDLQIGFLTVWTLIHGGGAR